MARKQTMSEDSQNEPASSRASDSQASLATPPDGVDLPRIQRAVREILIAVGENPDREGLLETPARVARMYAEMFAGLKLDPRVHTQKFFTEQYDEVVLVRDITFC
jgi:GTP cyclohydrolase I